MIRIRRLRSYITAYIAILAIVMLTAAPMISGYLQSEPNDLHRQHGGNADTVSSQTMLECEGVHSAHHTDAPVATAGGTGAHPLQKNDCGYCELLIHVPCFLWLFYPLIVMLPRFRRQVISSTAPRYYGYLKPSFYHTRAPPALSF